MLLQAMPFPSLPGLTVGPGEDVTAVWISASSGFGSENLPFGVEHIDDAGQFSAPSTDITIAAAGLYRMSFTYRTTGGSSSSPPFYWPKINGATPQGIGRNEREYSPTNFGRSVTIPLPLQQNDVVTLWSQGGGTLNAGDDYHFTVEKLPDDLNYCAVEKTSNQSFDASVWTNVTWQKVTAGDASWLTGDNVHFTVPAGVSRVRIAAGLSKFSGGAQITRLYNRLLKNDLHGNAPGLPYTWGDGPSSLQNYPAYLTPPLPVVPGDKFSVQTYKDRSYSALVVQAQVSTFFSIEEVPAGIIGAMASGTSADQVETGQGNAWGNLRFGAEVYDDAEIFDPAASKTDFVVPPGVSRARFHGMMYGPGDAGISMRAVRVRSGVTTSIGLYDSEPGPWGGMSRWVDVLPGDIFRLQLLDTISFSWGAADVSSCWAALECTA